MLVANAVIRCPSTSAIHSCADDHAHPFQPLGHVQVADQFGDPRAVTDLVVGVVGRGPQVGRDQLQLVATAVRLDGLTPHELRHTAASLAVSAGANVKAVQRMLGHASAAMTLDVYSGLFEDDLDGVAERLDVGARVYSMCTETPILPPTAESAGR